MGIQFLIVLIVVGAALVYGIYIFRGSLKSFSSKRNCGSNCGCGETSKELILRD